MSYGAIKATLRDMFWSGFWLGFVQGGALSAVAILLVWPWLVKVA
jgi:hypothetical protein